MKLKLYTLAGDTDANGTFADVFATEAERQDALLSHLEDSDDYTATPDGYARFVADHGDNMIEFIDRHRAEHLDTFSWDDPTIVIDLCAQPLPGTGREQAEQALECLRRARDLLKAAGNLQTLARVQAAISSAKGAVRIQSGRETRAKLEADARAFAAEGDTAQAADTLHSYRRSNLYVAGVAWRDGEQNDDGSTDMIAEPITLPANPNFDAPEEFGIFQRDNGSLVDAFPSEAEADEYLDLIARED